jgi:hypothetical protein
MSVTSFTLLASIDSATNHALMQEILKLLEESRKELKKISNYIERDLKSKKPNIDEISLLRDELNQIQLLQDTGLSPAELVSNISKLDGLLSKARDINGSADFICEVKLTLASFIVQDKSVNKFKEALSLLQEIEQDAPDSIKHETLNKLGKYAQILSMLCEELKPDYLDIMRAALIAEQEFIQKQLKNRQLSDEERTRYLQALAKSRKALARYGISFKKRPIDNASKQEKIQKK